MTQKQRLEGDKGFWERALHMEETASAKDWGLQRVKYDQNAMSMGKSSKK